MRDTLGTRGFSRVRREFSVLAEGRHIFGRRPRKPRQKSLWYPGYMRGDVTACSRTMTINRFLLCKNSSVQLFNSDSSYDVSKTSETFFFVQCVIKPQFFSIIRGAQMFVDLVTWRCCERNRTGTPVDDGKARGKDLTRLSLPICRSAIGQSSCLICAPRCQLTFPFCCQISFVIAWHLLQEKLLCSFMRKEIMLNKITKRRNEHDFIGFIRTLKYQSIELNKKYWN